MATDKASLSNSDARHFLEWLDEQRQLDHERIVLIAETVDQLRKEFRDQLTVTAVVESSTSGRSSTEARSGDGVVGNLGDHVGRLTRVVEEHIESQARAFQAETTSRDRDRRQVAESLLQIEALSRTVGLATSRLSALSEEIRHERDARAPMSNAMEDLERVQTSIATRLGALELMVRRVASTLAVVEVSDEKLQSGLSQADNQIKLIDLRVTREVAEVLRIVDEWRTRVDDQVKPVEGLSRQVAQLAEQRDAWQVRIAAIGDSVERLTREQTSLDNQAKTVRAAIQRGAEAAEAMSRRLDSAGGSIWQLGERLAGSVQELDQARSELQSMTELLEAITQRVALAEEGLQRGEAGQLALGLDLRNLRAETRTWAEGIEGRLDVDTTTLAAQSEARNRLSLEHLRRSVEELNQQIREIEATLT